MLPKMSFPGSQSNLVAASGRRILEQNISLLYFQGFWIEKSTPDLELYSKYLHPQLARLLVRFGGLRKAFEFFRKYNPWFVLGSIALHGFFLFPVGVYHFWSDKDARIENVVCTMLHSSTAVAFANWYLYKEKFQKIINDLEQISKKEMFDNEEQREMFRETNHFCRKLTKFVTSGIGIFPSTFTILVAFFVYIPNRTFLFREWYPYDATASPAFHLTLFVRIVGVIAQNLAMSVGSVTLFCILLYTRVHMKILNNKLRNISNTSLNNIRKRQVDKSRISAVVNDPAQNVQLVPKEGTSACVPDDVQDGSFSVHKTMPHTLPGCSRKIVEMNWSKNQSLLNTFNSRNNNILGKKEDESNDCTNDHIDRLIEKQISRETFGKLISSVNETKENTFSATMKGITADDLEAEIKIQLTSGIKMHQHILGLTGTFREACNIYLVQMSVINLLYLGLIVLILKTADEILISEITQVEIFLILVTIFLGCNYMANSITDESDAVLESLYDCDWLDASPSFKRSLLIAMIAATKPVEFKPTGFDPYSLESFGDIAARAFNMVSTLNQIM